MQARTSTSQSSPVSDVRLSLMTGAYDLTWNLLSCFMWCSWRLTSCCELNCVRARGSRSQRWAQSWRSACLSELRRDKTPTQNQMLLHAVDILLLIRSLFPPAPLGFLPSSVSLSLSVPLISFFFCVLVSFFKSGNTCQIVLFDVKRMSNTN